ncbi:MerC domain-containing protein [Hirschia baltica]|uniref:Putative transmembrane protein n=1 Tax=Hirschia baltica (strain ATCC 49814 / DSM 5838 / IFAM 1418) TaxID=582402 RepID=C6XKX7_HIRBI|nr:MerC domain-containing protein [Hirschia baltica]ACT57806.1 putative transmembrane protein [Hirschia baltica ATCC 49814]
MMNVARLDAVAIGLSGVCVIHCLALPVLVAFMPVFSQFSEAEWVHKFLVLLALPISGFAIFRSSSQPSKALFITLVSVGGLLLFSGAFIEAFHQIEVVLTLLGALTLSLAHLIRWRHSHLKPE